MLAVASDDRCCALQKVLGQTNIRVIRVTDSIESISSRIRTQPVDLVLVSVVSPSPDDWAILERLRSVAENVPIVVLGRSFGFEAIEKGMNLPLDAMLPEDISDHALLTSVSLILMGERVFPARIDET